MGIPLIFNKFLAGVLKKVRAKGILTYSIERTLMWINGFLKKNFNLNPVGKEIGQAVREVNQQFPSYKKIPKISILDEPMDMTSTKKIQRSKVERRIG